MRTHRGLLLTAVALAGLFPNAAEAQQGRRFENAWFWGLKGGGAIYQHATVGQNSSGETVAFPAENRHAPTVGLEWLITRTRGGLYASYDQGFLTETTGYVLDQFDSQSPVAMVSLSNTRRVNLAGMIFPPVTRWVQPYVGLGIAFVQVAGTETLNPEVFADGTQAAEFEAGIAEHRSQLQPLGMLGVQARLRPFSVFLQGSATQLNQDRFLLRGGRSAVFTYELGIRYNIGSSIERL